MRAKRLLSALAAIVALSACEDSRSPSTARSSAWVPAAPIISAEFPFASHFVEVDGVRMHYVDGGSGPVEGSPLPKLFLHAVAGAATPAGMVTWAKAHLKNMKSVQLGEGLHFLQEDHPHWIGAEIAQWSVDQGFAAAE